MVRLITTSYVLFWIRIGKHNSFFLKFVIGYIQNVHSKTKFNYNKFTVFAQPGCVKRLIHSVGSLRRLSSRNTAQPVPFPAPPVRYQCSRLHQFYRLTPSVRCEEDTFRVLRIYQFCFVNNCLAYKWNLQLSRMFEQCTEKLTNFDVNKCGHRFTVLLE